MSRSERGPTEAEAGVARSRLTWRTPLRAALRYGLPFAGCAVILFYAVASVGGNISHLGFAAGVLLILASVSARLIKGR